MASESVLDQSSVLAVGVKVPDQVMLSLLVIAASAPDVVPLSRLGTVMSAALEKEAEVTGSGKTTVSVAVWPYKSNGLLRVKVGTPLVEGGISSTI